MGDAELDGDGDAEEGLRPTVAVARSVFQGEQPVGDSDQVIVETPIALAFNGISYAVMMATPADLDDFIRGFAITEGVVEQAREIYDIDCVVNPTGIELDAKIASQAAHRLKERRRSMAGPSGCGLCGLESIDQIMRPLNVLPETRVPSQAALDRAISQFRPAQTLSLQTAGAHAAAWCSWDGDLMAIREDVGRHNALDKLLGWHSLNTPEGFVLVSSRASYEMVSKCVVAGVGVLAAMSAPTSMAIHSAKTANLNLLAFTSSGRHARYS